jgi:phage gpG-like protein
VTLRDAAHYITKLPKAEQQLDEWQTAIEALIMAAEGRGPLMHSRIGVLRALHRDVERVFTDRKETHWGKRKLKRDTA